SDVNRLSPVFCRERLSTKTTKACVMKTLIVYTSVHHKNTEKVARVMAAELEADLVPAADAHPDSLRTYDLIGFGSSIFYGEMHKTLLKFVESLPAVTGKRAFVFSTCGIMWGLGGPKKHTPLKQLLEDRGFSLVGDFSCLGWDTVGLLRHFGGVNTGRPSVRDLEKAQAFARRLKEKYA
ncbi:MAG: flavodoxin family protein, partial [Halobacteriota archaeon]